MLRPKATVLPDSALVPPENLRAPPKRFTHEVTARQPYHHVQAAVGTQPAGALSPGAKVLLLERGEGPLCRVKDAQGLCVWTPFAGLHALR